MKKRYLLVALTVIWVVVLCFGFWGCFSTAKNDDFSLNFIVEGEVYHTITTKGKEKITLPPNPSLNGYIFSGWYWDNDVWEKPFTASSLLDTRLSSNMSVYAKWENNTFTISFESNGGSLVNSITKEAGENISAPTAPTRTGYTFGGWFVDNVTFKNEFTFNVMPAEDMELYAKWILGDSTIPSEYIVTFNAKGGSLVDSCTVAPNSYVEMPESVRPGYSFDGWYTSANNGITLDKKWSFDSDVVNSNIVLYAKWIAHFELKNEFNNYVITNTTDLSKNFSHIDIPPVIDGKKVTEIRAAFVNNNNLTSITIPESVTNIGPNSFLSCSNLLSINIPDSVKNIGNLAFSACISLTTITIPNSVTSIGTEVFSGCAAEICWEDSPAITTIVDKTFKGYKGERLTIPNSVKSIGTFAFANCDNLSSITIPNSVTSVGESAFLNCSSLTTVTIPNSVTSIGESAFSGCGGLVSMSLPFVGKEITAISDKALFGYIFGTSAYPGSDEIEQLCNTKKYKYYIPTSLETVTIAGGYLKDGAFYNCVNLKSIILSDSIKSIGERAFYNCSSLISCNIPSEVNTISSYAFSKCSSLSSIIIREGVTAIETYAFSECSNLSSISMPSNVTSIGDKVFYKCNSLILIDVDNDNPNYKSIDGNLYNKDATMLVQYAMGKDVTNFEIPSSVTAIGNSAFSYCNSLESVIIPNGMIAIGRDAFYYCRNLLSIIIPDNVTSIGYQAFYYCDRLNSITIGKGVKNIDPWAFYGCSSLGEVNITDLAAWCAISFELYSNPLYFAKNLYINDQLATDITIPSGVTSIENGVFYNCVSLNSVIIPSSVVIIGRESFYNCTNLATVTFENTTGWYETEDISATSGESITVTLPKMNASKLQNNHKYYWKRNP